MPLNRITITAQGKTSIKRVLPMGKPSAIYYILYSKFILILSAKNYEILLSREKIPTKAQKSKQLMNAIVIISKPSTNDHGAS